MSSTGSQVRPNGAAFGVGSVEPDDTARAMHAYATDNARVYQAGHDIHISLAHGDTRGKSLSHDARSRPVFIQYLNPEILACYGLRITNRDNYYLLASAIHYTRLAILVTDACLLVPASCIFEVPNIQVFLRATDPLIRTGILRYVASIPDLEAYRDSKVSEYRRDGSNPYIVNAIAFGDWLGTFLGEPRHVSTTVSDIGSEWPRALSPGGSLHGVEQSLSQRWRGRKPRLTKMLQSIPQRLEGEAFIGRFVRNVVPLEFNTAESLRIDFFLSQAYLVSYLLDLDANMLVDFDVHNLSCGLRADSQEFGNRLISVRALGFILKVAQIYSFVCDMAQWDDLLALRETPELALLSLFAFKGRDLYEVRRAAARVNTLDLDVATSLSATLSNVQRLVDTLLQQT